MEAPDTPPAGRAQRRIPFRELNARVGERLQLLVPRYANKRSFGSALVGWIEDEFVIVRRPVDTDGPVPLVVGEGVTVRLFTGTDVAEFASAVQRVFTGGVTYVHLDYPSAVKALTLRAESRVPVDLPAVVGVEGQEGAIEVRVRDLSRRGARLQAQRPVGAPGTRVALRIRLPDGDADAPAVEFPAEIRSSRPLTADAPDGACVCGVQFGALDEAQQAFVRRSTGRAD